MRKEEGGRFFQRPEILAAYRFLAAQFGVPESDLYRCLLDCLAKMKVQQPEKPQTDPKERSEVGP